MSHPIGFFGRHHSPLSSTQLADWDIDCLLHAVLRSCVHCYLQGTPDARTDARSILTTKDTNDTKEDHARSFRVIRVFRGSDFHTISRSLAFDAERSVQSPANL
jgi:hypothetical protein